MFSNRIPLSYNLRSIRARFTSTIVAILGIAGVVAVFLAMMSLANGFRSTMMSAGSPDNAIIRRSGSNSEMDSVVTLDEFRVVRDFPEIARDPVSGEPLAIGEVVAVVSLPFMDSDIEANVQMRGIFGDPFTVREHVRITAGRYIEPGKAELVAGSTAIQNYANLGIGSELAVGGRKWLVVGHFDASGSTYDSEVWTDAIIASETFARPTNIFQSMTVTLNQGADLKAFNERLASDPRLNISAQSEIEYYKEKSEMITRLITSLGVVIVMVMGVGAVFAALNTMSATISARYREIATLRALGFKRRSIVLSFVIESLIIALAGAVIGCLLILPLNGYQASTMNWETFSHIGFSLKLSLPMVLSGFLFASVMGLIGGLIPASHAVNQSIVGTFRRM